MEPRVGCTAASIDFIKFNAVENLSAVYFCLGAVFKIKHLIIIGSSISYSYVNHTTAAVSH